MGIGKRVASSIKAVPIGLAVMIACIGVLAWNEYNSVKNAGATDEAVKTFVQAGSETVNPDNEGKLVATYGRLEVTDEAVTDDMYNVSVNSAILVRTVEMYQWKETSSKDNEGGTVYRYDKVWSQEPINSRSFHESGHDNPDKMPVESKTFMADNVKVGAFQLSAGQKEMLSQEGSVSEFDLSQAREKGYTSAGRYITSSADITAPKIGDVRISYTYNTSKEVSLLACQFGSTFTDYWTRNGVRLNRVADGVIPGKELIAGIKEENKALTWSVRVAAALAMMMGLGMILGPLKAVSARVPILGSLVGMGVGLVSFLAGLGISLLVIALSWIAVRPLVGIGLLAAAAAIVVLLIRAKKQPSRNIPPDASSLET